MPDINHNWICPNINVKEEEADVKEDSNEDTSDTVEQYDKQGNNKTRLNVFYLILSRSLRLLPLYNSSKVTTKPNMFNLLTEVLQFWLENKKKSVDHALEIPCRNYVTFR